MRFLLLLIYTIAFHSGNADSSSPATSVDKIIDNATYNVVTGHTVMNKVYRAKDGYGIKLGTTSVKGELSLTLDTTYFVSTMTVWAASVYGKDTTSSGITLCGQNVAWQAPSKVLRPYTITLNRAISSIELQTNRASYGRAYVQKIEMEVEDDYASRGKIGMPQYFQFDFPSMEFDAQQPATDDETFIVSAKDITGEGLSVQMQNGSVFGVSPSHLPQDGGEIVVSYSYDAVGYGLKDTVVVSGVGANGQIVRQRMPVKVDVYQYTPQPVDSAGMVISVNPTENYYLSVEQLCDSSLKSGLASIINCGVRYRYGSGNNHTWAAFWYTDRDTFTNQVLDMYSSEVRYFNPDNPTASVAGFDIEHMLPKSWWGGTVNAAYCDLYHLVPGDYSANRSKSNHAPGVPSDSSFYNGSFVTGVDWEHGLARVFCPADEYKGDFARAYFYIACCYGDELVWVSNGDAGQAMTNSSWQEFQPWLRDLLLSWHRADPVSEKETTRAIAVNRIQGNRNPFIDYPDLVEYIWGDRQGMPVAIQSLPCSFQNQGCSMNTEEDESTVVKIIENGRVWIIRNGSRYDVLGNHF